jgi:hypothetical protein
LHSPLQDDERKGHDMKKLSGLAAAWTMAAGLVVMAQTNGVAQRFTAMAVNMNNGG